LVIFITDVLLKIIILFFGTQTSDSLNETEHDNGRESGGKKEINLNKLRTERRKKKHST
jgi:hypothetical protein